MMIQKNDIRTRAWGFFLTKGIPEYGIAGLMGNLYAESGIIPDRVETLCLKRLYEHYGIEYDDKSYTAAVDSGKLTREQFLHPIPGRQYGYGLAQWTSPGRKSGLYDLCKERGSSIGDLSTQLEFLWKELNTYFPKTLAVIKEGRSIAEVSDYVLIHFESPADADSMKEIRRNFSKEIYDLYGSGGKMSPKDVTLCGHGSGHPSLKNMQEYCQSRYNQYASNGKRKGVVCVKRFIALNDSGRKKFHDTYKTILGRNNYSQDYREYCYTPMSNGEYYSDCSSSICLTYKKIGYECPDYNTAGIYYSGLFETVPVTIKNGQISDPELLKVGDCLLFVGNDPSRPLQIGHVEAVYEINGSSGGGNFMFELEDVYEGCKGESVRLLQEIFRARGSAGNPVFKDQNGELIEIDCDCGKKTSYVIRQYQEARTKAGADVGGVDGICGKKTWHDLIPVKMY